VHAPRELALFGFTWTQGSDSSQRAARAGKQKGRNRTTEYVRTVEADGPSWICVVCAKKSRRPFTHHHWLDTRHVKSLMLSLIKGELLFRLDQSTASSAAMTAPVSMAIPAHFDELRKVCREVCSSSWHCWPEGDRLIPSLLHFAAGSCRELY
jgi:hypothetical protein